MLAGHTPVLYSGSTSFILSAGGAPVDRHDTAISLDEAVADLVRIF